MNSLFVWFLVIFSIIFSPLFVSAEVSYIDFTNPVRSVISGEASKVITIELKNSSGVGEALGETGTLTLTSTSPTGRFVNNPTEMKDLSLTINSNWKSRSFYYTDSTEGTFIITAIITGKISGKSFTNSQTIIVGQGDNTDNSNTDSDTDNSDNDNTSTENDSDDTTSQNETVVTKDTSSHGSSKRLSTYSKKSSVKVGAGRARTVLVNTPIYFEPETSQKNDIRTKRGDFVWSFGDGSSDSGRFVKHTYYFPGEYNVVLNTKEYGEEVVSRTKVKVIEPSVEIVDVVTGDHGYVEIKNNSSMEVNINGWDIKSGKRHYLVAEDTIIDPKSSIKIPNKVMMFDPVDEVSFVYPNDEVHMVYSPKKKVDTELASTVPVYYSYNYEKPKVKEDLTQKISTGTVSNLNQTANVSNTGMVSKFWGGIKSLFFVH